MENCHFMITKKKIEENETFFKHAIGNCSSVLLNKVANSSNYRFMSLLHINYYFYRLDHIANDDIT